MWGSRWDTRRVDYYEHKSVRTDYAEPLTVKGCD
jgi:hypothetical protein